MSKESDAIPGPSSLASGGVREPWRNATSSTPGAMRLLYTSPEANKFHPVLQPGPGDRWPEHPIVAVIGPFDNHMGQRELQDRLLALLRQWNAECAAADTTGRPLGPGNPP